jgi:hypothetical protein
MVSGQDNFFHGILVPRLISPIAQGSKKGVGSKIGVHPTGWPKEGVVCLWVLGGHNSAY